MDCGVGRFQDFLRVKNRRLLHNNEYAFMPY